MNIDFLISIIYFVIGLGLLIFIHELGHFSIAKLCGIKVEQFSLGFGPRLIGFKKGETEYRIAALPFGGYVKMYGEEPEEGEESTAKNDPRSFAAQGVLRRIAVVLAGPTMNIVLAFVLLPLAFLIGSRVFEYRAQVPEVLGVVQESPAQKAGIQKGDRILAIDQIQTENWGQLLDYVRKHPNKSVTLQVFHSTQNLNETYQIKLDAKMGGLFGWLGIEPDGFLTPPVVHKVVPKTPAEEAGILPKDRITKMNGNPVNSIQELMDAINASQGNLIKIDLIRDGKEESISLKPIQDPDSDSKRWIVGIHWKNPDLKKTFVSRSLNESIQQGTSEVLWQAKVTYQAIKQIFTFQNKAYKNVGGPVQIFLVSTEAARYGFGNFLMLLSSLSLSLGIFNLLPIPVLDGGHLMFMLYEGIVRKPLSLRKRMMAQQVGISLLITLMVVVTIKDLLGTELVQNIFARISGWF